MPIKDVFNLKTLFSTSNETYLQQYNFIGDTIILLVFGLFLCIFGLVGNGYIVWLLGFCIKRNPFSIYIMNLAVADSATLLMLLPWTICLLPSSGYEYFLCSNVFAILLEILLQTMNSCGQILATAISIDRWVSVLFPNWHKPHQSPVLSTTVCVFIWTFCVTFIGVPCFLNEMDYYLVNAFLDGYVITVLICFFLMIISTLTLLIKICLKSQQGQCRNLSKVMLLMLLSFILCNTLTTVCGLMMPSVLPAYMYLGMSLRGSINPLIYLLAGRQNSGKFQKKMKIILQRLFKEEKDPGMELQPRTQTVL